MDKALLIINTLKYLKPIQVFFRIYYFLKNKIIIKKKYHGKLKSKPETLIWKHYFLYRSSYFRNNEFKFLNTPYKFDNQIDWNYNAFGKLWTYNLNYFDFLNQKGITKDEGKELIKNYIKKDSYLKDGKEPYPISLRGINWIKFISIHQICDQEIDQYLFWDYQILYHNLEYHILANHLLENGFSLFFGAYYFKNAKYYKKAIKILTKELEEQILKDGAHFELSPMYHQILLNRLLDCINLNQLNPEKFHDNIISFLKEKAIKMLSWLAAVTYRNGKIPMVNDSAYNIAPSSKELFAYATQIGLNWRDVILSDSGYRKIVKGKYELFLDVGNIGPDYQPGHAHADTFSFELYLDDAPVIVDTGTSTYEKNELRQSERSTSAHNTVKIGAFEQTEIWGGFRVGNRAKIKNLYEDNAKVMASHNGYKKIGILHKRSFETLTNNIRIQDILTSSKEIKYDQAATLHFHPRVTNIEIESNQITLSPIDLKIQFEGNISKIEQKTYYYALGFNNRVPAKKVVIHFENDLSTNLIL